MKKYLLFAVFGLFVAPLSFSSILKLPNKSFSLPNGLKIILVKYPSPGVVAYQLAVHAGSRNEVEKGKTGFAHFFEHLMFRGTKNRSGKEFGKLYARLGNENNAWTSTDMTCYHGVVAATYLPLVLDAEADRFANLHFEERELRDEAGAVLGEYNKGVAQPGFLLEEKLNETAFKVHPYSHTTMGYKDDVLKFPERYSDVWPFFKRYYRPSNVTVVLVGDIDFSKAQALVEEKFKSWKDPEIEQVTIPQEPEQKEPRTAEVKLNKPTQTRITVSYKVPAFSTKSKDSASLSILSEILFSTTSEFQKKYRFSLKWVDEISASAQESVDPGLWTISLRLSQEGESKEKELLAALDETMKAVRTKEINKTRLEQTKKRFSNFAITGFFSRPDSLASAISYYTNLEPDLGVIDRMFLRINEVTPVDLKSFAGKYLLDTRKTTVTLRGSK